MECRKGISQIAILGWTSRKAEARERRRFLAASYQIGQSAPSKRSCNWLGTLFRLPSVHLSWMLDYAKKGCASPSAGCGLAERSFGLNLLAMAVIAPLAG